MFMPKYPWPMIDYKHPVAFVASIMGGGWLMPSSNHIVGVPLKMKAMSWRIFGGKKKSFPMDNFLIQNIQPYNLHLQVGRRFFCVIDEVNYVE